MGRLLRTYSELTQFTDWDSRFEYLRLNGIHHKSPREHSHPFYTSRPWRKFKQEMHERDYGCDLGIISFEIDGRRYLHHINPVTIEDLENYNEDILLNPENVITASGDTHNKIHYLKLNEPIYFERKAGDTTPWL